jgi:putative ABC transport system permease protein
MIKLKLIFKSIIKYPTSLGLNLLSLIITFTGIIFLSLYVSFEYSFDKYNQNYDSVYRVIVGKDGVSVPAKIAPIIKDNITEVEAITPYWQNSYYISTDELMAKKQSFYSSGFYANSDILNIFTFPLIYGDKNTALSKAHTIIISKDLSIKLFGNSNPIGENVLLDNTSFTVSGVMQNIPKNSSIYADFIISFITISQKPDDAPNTWEEWSYRVFIKLNKNADANDVMRNINHIDEFVEHFGLDKDAEDKAPFILKPLSQLHFSNDELFVTVNLKVLHVLLILIFVLLIMGIVNFINITLAQSFKRVKALSVMKILGAEKKNNINQIILEALLVSVIALLLSFLLHRLLLPYLQDLLQIKGFDFGNRIQWYFYYLILAVVFGLIAGLYPAIYLSSQNLAKSLKGAHKFTAKGKIIRNSLLILQFVFAIVLISISIGISKQLDYWHNYNIGIQKDNVVYMHCSRTIMQHNDAFVKELLNNSEITDHAFSSFAPGGVGMGWGREVNGKHVNFRCWPIDENFLDFFGIKIIKGKAFSKTLGVDKNKFIFNEKAISSFDWKDPLKLSISGFNFEGAVIGVCKDFNFASLKDDIEPMAFWLTTDNSWKSTLFLRINPKNQTQLLKFIQETWKKFDPIQEQDIQFLDESLNRLYNREERIAHFIKLASIWSILLSLTGLLGLVIFSSRERTKEIGIRKVNGASVITIINMLNSYFLRWLIIAFVVAVPIAYFALNSWLENFEYKTNLSWWIFALAGLITFIISIITISIFTYKTAQQNPVKSLRYE